MTEDFIEKWMRNENGTLATYIKDGNAFDEDLVKGREALAETLGLWMLYALEKDDKRLFDDSYQILQRYFLNKKGFVSWKLTESGESEVYTNALVDDLRIIDALFQGNEKWGGSQYEKTAILISRYVNKHNMKKKILTDFYERQHQYSSDSLTLSYIDQKAIEKMKDFKVLDEQTFERTRAVLKNAPQKKGFYPKSYDVMKHSYVFEENVNMVDQAYVAYQQVLIGNVSRDFLDFISNEIKQHGVVYGRYDIQTNEPAVNYESPAVYGLLIMYCLETGEVNLANTLYERMIMFRNNDEKNSFYGGYSVNGTGNTHIFDNLVPLLAEKKYINYYSKDSR